MSDYSMSSGSESLASDDSSSNSSDESNDLSVLDDSDFDFDMSESSAEALNLRSEPTLYYLLSRLPNKDLSDLDVTRGWHGSLYGLTLDREHILGTLKALNVGYASVAYIVWLAVNSEYLIQAHEALIDMPPQALNARWYRDAVRFYTLHVVDNYAERTPTTIDVPGKCAFDSIVSSLPDFAMLQRCLYFSDGDRTLYDFVNFQHGIHFNVDGQCRAAQERAFFYAHETFSDLFSDFEYNGLIDEFFVHAAHRVHFLQKDCTILEPRNGKEYTKEDIVAYLRSFDNDDDLVSPDRSLDVYTPTVQEKDTEDEKRATRALLIKLELSMDGSPWGDTYSWIDTES